LKDQMLAIDNDAVEVKYDGTQQGWMLQRNGWARHAVPLKRDPVRAKNWL